MSKKSWLPMAIGGALGIGLFAANPHVPLSSILTWGFAAMAVCWFINAARGAPAGYRYARPWRRAQLVMACGAAVVAIANQWHTEPKLIGSIVGIVGSAVVVGGLLWLRSLRTTA